LQNLKVVCAKCSGKGHVFKKIKGDNFRKEDCPRCRGYGYLLTNEGVSVMRELALLQNLFEEQAF
jgi:DnaJ-class molecular chaperone